MNSLWPTIRPFVYFIILIGGSLFFLYLFDRIGGDGKYAGQLEAEVHKFGCDVRKGDNACKK